MIGVHGDLEDRFRARVQDGRRDAAFDIALTVGVAGFPSVAALPLLAPFASVYRGHIQTLLEAVTSSHVWSREGAYGSSGSTTCGSGGGCGGSGCGGGGCGDGKCS